MLKPSGCMHLRPVGEPPTTCQVKRPHRSLDLTYELYRSTGYFLLDGKIQKDKKKKKKKGRTWAPFQRRHRVECHTTVSDGYFCRRASISERYMTILHSLNCQSICDTDQLISPFQSLSVFKMFFDPELDVLSVKFKNLVTPPSDCFLWASELNILSCLISCCCCIWK